MNEFKNIFSQIQPYDFKGIEKLLDDIKGYKYVVIYNINEVLIEFAEKIPPKKLEKFTELRAFNNDGELAVRSYGGKYKGRIRTDGIGENTEYIDVHYVRNALAHADKLSKDKLKDFKNCINDFYSLYKNKFKEQSGKENKEALELVLKATFDRFEENKKNKENKK